MSLAKMAARRLSARCAAMPLPRLAISSRIVAESAHRGNEVRCGSIASILRCPRQVRLASDCGQTMHRSESARCATGGHPVPRDGTLKKASAGVPAADNGKAQSTLTAAWCRVSAQRVPPWPLRSRAASNADLQPFLRPRRSYCASDRRRSDSDRPYWSADPPGVRGIRWQ